MSETKEIITTLKAESVIDVVIEKKGNSYPSNFECVIPVKVGNKVENLTFEFGRNYSSTDRTPIAHIASKSKNIFAALEEAGIEIDYSDVIEAYKNAIEVCKEIIEFEKAEAIKLAKIKRAEFYDNSWVKAFIENVDGDKRFEMKDYEFSFMDRERYINGNEVLFVKLTYKGITGNFKYSDYYVSHQHSFRGTNEMKYNVCNGYKTRDDGSIESLTITGDKDRKGKLPKSVVHRWFQDVDEYLAIQESRKSRLTKEENERKELIEFLSEKSGKKIEAKREHVYRDSRNGGSYYVWNYYINIKPVGEEHSRELKVNYNDYHKVFSIDGLNALNEFQFKTIIDILYKKIQ